MNNKLSIKHDCDLNLIILEYILEFFDLLSLPSSYENIIQNLKNKVGEKIEITTYYEKRSNNNAGI